MEHLGVTRIGLHAEVGNEASQRAAQRAGFRQVQGPPQPLELKGVMRDVVRYERTKN
jgi:RimJ/RimL family protein N-acetyltransferase